MKIVQKVCPVCRGIGYVSWINTAVNATENTVSATSKICPHCGGKCLREVPMSNADRIRTMSDEELARLVFMGREGLFCNKYSFECEKECSCEDCVLDWLQQPAEEEV